jgi:hypothetical protein
MELDALLKQFKNNNKEYIKIRFMAKQTVKSALSDNRQQLKYAVLSIIDSMRADPIKFNSLIHGTPLPLTISKPTIIDYTGGSRNYHTNLFSHYSNQNGYDEILAEVLVNEATKLYKKMVEDFTNQTISNAAPDSNVTFLPTIIYSNKQTHTLFSY